MGQLTTIGLIMVAMGVLIGTNNISAFPQDDVLRSSLVKRVLDPNLPDGAPLDRSAHPSSLAKDYLHELIERSQLELDQLLTDGVAERSGGEQNNKHYPLLKQYLKSTKDEVIRNNLDKQFQEQFSRESQSVPVDDPDVMEAFSAVKTNILKTFSMACSGTSTSSFQVSPLISASKYDLWSQHEILFTVIQKGYDDKPWHCRARIRKISGKLQHGFDNRGPVSTFGLITSPPRVDFHPKNLRTHDQPPTMSKSQLTLMNCQILWGPKFTVRGVSVRGDRFEIRVPNEM